MVASMHFDHHVLIFTLGIARFLAATNNFIWKEKGGGGGGSVIISQQAKEIYLPPTHFAFHFIDIILLTHYAPAVSRGFPKFNKIGKVVMSYPMCSRNT